MQKSGFSKISDILNESALAQGAFGQALDKTMLFSFWKNVVGKKFEKLSHPYDLKGGILFVSAKSPAVVQELSFFKADIIEKYAPYALGLNLKIKDIRFDYKNWAKSSENNSSDAFDTDVPDYYTDKDYETICLDNNEEEEFQQLRETLDGVKFLPKNIKDKMFDNFTKLYKAKKLRKMSCKNPPQNP